MTQFQTSLKIIQFFQFSRHNAPRLKNKNEEKQNLQSIIVRYCPPLNYPLNPKRNVSGVGTLNIQAKKNDTINENITVNEQLGDLEPFILYLIIM